MTLMDTAQEYCRNYKFLLQGMDCSGIEVIPEEAVRVQQVTARHGFRDKVTPTNIPWEQVFMFKDRTRLGTSWVTYETADPISDYQVLRGDDLKEPTTDRNWMDILFNEYEKKTVRKVVGMPEVTSTLWESIRIMVAFIEGMLVVKPDIEAMRLTLLTEAHEIISNKTVQDEQVRNWIQEYRRQK